MKNLKLLAVFVIFSVVVSASVNATGFRKDFKNYEIELVDDLNLGKSVDKVWILTYNSSQNPITVAKHKTGEGTEYVVHSNFFEVCYAATSNGFGVKRVKNSWRSVPRQISKAVINEEQMKRQEVISPSRVDDERALGLIAAYLPELINDDYTHVLN